MTRKCDHCKKKTSLLSFDCKCHYKILCTNCKLPEIHSCNRIDEFKKEAKELISKNNPIVISDKLINI